MVVEVFFVLTVSSLWLVLVLVFKRGKAEKDDGKLDHQLLLGKEKNLLASHTFLRIPSTRISA